MRSADTDITDIIIKYVIRSQYPDALGFPSSLPVRIFNIGKNVCLEMELMEEAERNPGNINPNQIN